MYAQIVKCRRIARGRPHRTSPIAWRACRVAVEQSMVGEAMMLKLMAAGITTCAAVAVLVASSSQATHAQQGTSDPMQMTGNQFEALFAEAPSMREIALATIAKRIGEEDLKNPHHFICWPPGSTYLQAGKVIGSTLTQYPQVLNMPIHDIAVAALLHAFGCPS